MTEREALRVEVLTQWLWNHAEHCTNILNDDWTCPCRTATGGCRWPLPATVADATDAEFMAAGDFA